VSVEQTLGQHQLDNANTYLGVRELLEVMKVERKKSQILFPCIYEVYIHVSNVPTLLICDL